MKLISFRPNKKDMEGIAKIRGKLLSDSDTVIIRYALAAASREVFQNVPSRSTSINAVSPAKTPLKLCPKHGLQLMAGKCSNGCDLN